MSSGKPTKKSAFSCEPCRRRKVKCSGEQPVCQRCAARNDACIYKLNPTLSYTQRLEERIKELERRLTDAGSAGAAAVAAAHSPPLVSPTDPRHKDAGEDPERIAHDFKGLKLDDKGGITYYGATSFFNLPSEPRLHRPPFHADDVPSSDADGQRRERLIHNAWQQRALEDLSTIPEPFQYLLRVHWCWIQPMFNFVYRPAFTRDMESLGPYYSHTLLNAIISHSIRWGQNDPSTKRLLEEKYKAGAVFDEFARSRLFDELSRGLCTIPTIQTLLLLSAQECSQGNSSQAWTYSGIAFRIADHLGICVDAQRFLGSVSLSDEELEIRLRIFWGCYFWDKLISLYLGRSPSLRLSDVSPPQVMYPLEVIVTLTAATTVDDSAEDEIWVPFGAQRVGMTWNYPPATAHSASCFTNMCRLSVIFSEILVHMYDPLSQNTNAEVRACLQNQEPELRKWWNELPPHLKMEPFALPSLAPPSHIVTLNCLYHTFKILLYRPMLTGRGTFEDDGMSPVRASFGECLTSATAIITIFDLFCRTYTMNYCVLSLAYSVYTAASIFLLQIQAAPDEGHVIPKLSYCVQCLDQVKEMNPIINSALGLIVKEMAALSVAPGAAMQRNWHQHQHHEQTEEANSDILVGEPMYTIPEADTSRRNPLPSHPLLQPALARNVGSETMSMSSNVFQTMSTLEPLTVRVGALQGFETPTPSNTQQMF